MNRVNIFIILFLLSVCRLFSIGDISLGYYGEVISHPGISVSLTQTFFEYKEVSLNIREEVVAYTHPRNHNMVGFNIYLPLSFFTNYKVSGEIFIGSGYLMKFTNSEKVYYGDRTGEVKSKDYVLFHRFSLNVGVGFSIKLFEFRERSVGLYVRPLAFWEYPVSNNFLIHPVLSIGVSYE